MNILVRDKILQIRHGSACLDAPMSMATRYWRPPLDAGLTGFKIVVITYVDYARHGGVAFSCNDPTLIDCSAAYVGRYLAKSLGLLK